MSHSAELGIDVDFSEVNLVEGANFNPEFLKLVSPCCLSIVYAFIDVVSSQNPNASLPTLTHEGKSYKSTAEVIDYIVSISSTKVAPETSITKVVHEDGIDPNFSMVAAVRPYSYETWISYHNDFRGMMMNSPRFRVASQTSSTQLVSNDAQSSPSPHLRSKTPKSTAHTLCRSRPFEKVCSDT